MGKYDRVWVLCQSPSTAIRWHGSPENERTSRDDVFLAGISAQVCSPFSFLFLAAALEDDPALCRSNPSVTVLLYIPLNFRVARDSKTRTKDAAWTALSYALKVDHLNSTSRHLLKGMRVSAVSRWCSTTTHKTAIPYIGILHRGYWTLRYPSTCCLPVDLYLFYGFNRWTRPPELKYLHFYKDFAICRYFSAQAKYNITAIFYISDFRISHSEFDFRTVNQISGSNLSRNVSSLRIQGFSHLPIHSPRS